MDDDAIEDEQTVVLKHIMEMMQQKERIPSALPKSFLQSVDVSYVCHISENIGWFGSVVGSHGHSVYENGFKEYTKEVDAALKQKAFSVQRDGEMELPELLLVNKGLVVKWQWIWQQGIFDGMC